METVAYEKIPEMKMTVGKLPIYKFKIMLLGETAVGKTALLKRLIEDKTPIIFEPSATAGAEFFTKTLCLSDAMITLKIADSSGQERELLRMYYADCDGAVIVYDITNRKSFYEAQKMVTEIRERDSKKKLIVLAGNKADMIDNRMVSLNEAQEYSHNYNLIFTETSAVSALNVEYCFDVLAEKLFDRIMQDGNSRMERADSVVRTTCCLCCCRKEDKLKNKKNSPKDC